LGYPNVNTVILSKLLIALMRFPRLDAAFYTQTPHECTISKLNDVHHAWYLFSQYGPLDSGGFWVSV
jgi:hypothetical protein